MFVENELCAYEKKKIIKKQRETTTMPYSVSQLA